MLFVAYKAETTTQLLPHRTLNTSRARQKFRSQRNADIPSEKPAIIHVVAKTDTISVKRQSQTVLKVKQ